MITHNLNIVAAELMALPKIIEKNVTDLVIKLGLSIATSIIKATPVDTGLAKGNWQMSLANPLMDEITRKNGQEAISEAKQVSLAFTLKDKSIWICNNLPYINALNNGWSKRQAPAGYIENAVEKVHISVAAKKLL